MARVNFTYAEIMQMDKPTFLRDVVIPCGAAGEAAYKKLCSETSEHKKYPRTKAESKKHPGKIVSVADKTQKPEIVVSPITFFELKKRFAKRVLKLTAAAPSKKPTFRNSADDDIAKIKAEMAADANQ